MYLTPIIPILGERDQSDNCVEGASTRAIGSVSSTLSLELFLSYFTVVLVFWSFGYFRLSLDLPRPTPPPFYPACHRHHRHPSPLLLGQCHHLATSYEHTNHIPLLLLQRYCRQGLLIVKQTLLSFFRSFPFPHTNAPNPTYAYAHKV